MSNIEVGEWIRTDKGYIEKIKDFKPHYTKGKRLGKKEEVVENFLLMGAKQCRLIESIDYSIPPCYPSDEELEKIKKHIVNHSKNIIDLIEKDDVIKIIENGIISVHLLDEEEYLEMWLEDIRNGCVKLLSIVTKEMFLNAEYKVGE